MLFSTGKKMWNLIIDLVGFWFWIIVLFHQNKFFLVETPYSVGVLNPKTHLNRDLGSISFILGSLAYKLVNLLVFEKIL